MKTANILVYGNIAVYIKYCAVCLKINYTLKRLEYMCSVSLPLRCHRLFIVQTLNCTVNCYRIFCFQIISLYIVLLKYLCYRVTLKPNGISHYLRTCIFLLYYNILLVKMFIVWLLYSNLATLYIFKTCDSNFEVHNSI